MDFKNWIKKNCKFAANISGPIPRDEYFSGDNIYGHYLDDNIYFDAQSGRLKLTTDVGEIWLNLTPEQTQQLSAPFEADIREGYSMSVQSKALESLARELMVGKGEEDKDWRWNYEENEGLVIYHPQTLNEILVLSNEELTKRGIPGIEA